MTDNEKMELIHDFGPVLRRIDETLMGCRYIPRHMNSLNNEYIALDFIGKTKYIKVTDKNPFQIVNHIIGAMNDYCFTVQYEPHKIANILNEELEKQEEQEK